MEIHLDDKIRKLLKLRTEDIHLSPSKKYVVFAAFEDHKVVILRIDNNLGIFDKYLVLEGGAFKKPHGACWLDDNNIAVANRFSDTIVITFTDNDVSNQHRTVTSFNILKHKTISNYKDLKCSCVRSVNIRENIYDIFVCSNVRKCVLHFTYDITTNTTIDSDVLLFENKLLEPDGIAINKEQSLIAVADFKQALTFIFDYNFLTKETHLLASLKGAKHPHGVIFVGNRVFTTCAGTPYIYEFINTKDRWDGDYTYTKKHRCIEEETFNIYHVNATEGGAKGIEVFDDTVVTTCESTPFFKLKI